MPEQQSFQPGDVVQLKCGGGQMVVQEVQNDGYVYCIWRDERGAVCGHGLTAATLMRYEPAGYA